MSKRPPANPSPADDKITPVELPRPFWILFAGTLINRTGGFVIIFLAIYLTEVRGLSPSEAGVIISAYGFGAVFAGPIGGALSDRIGRRVTLVASLVTGGISMIALGRAGAAGLPVMAAITGLFYEMYRPVVSATIADIVAPSNRARAYSLNYWAVNLGASVAPLLGSAIAARSYQLMFVIDGLTAVAYGVLLLLALPETQPTAVAGRNADAMTILRDGPFLVFCLLTFGIHLVFFQFFVGLPVDMRAHGVSTSAYGALVAINPILVVLLQIPAGELIARRSQTRVLSLASLLIGTGFGCMAWSGSSAAYVIGIVLFTLGEILFAPASVAFVADVAPAEARGRYQGAFALAFTTAFAAAPAVGGYVLGAAGGFWLWMGCLMIGVLVALGFLVVDVGSRLKAHGSSKMPGHEPSSLEP